MSISVPQPQPNKPAMDIKVHQRGQPIQRKRLRDRLDNDRHLAFYDRGPGAGGYLLPTLTGKKDHDLRHHIAPEYTMRPFLQSSFQLAGLVGPGTGYYKIPEGLTHHGQFYPYEQTFGHKTNLRTAGEKLVVGPGSHDLPPPDVYLYHAGSSVIIPKRFYYGNRVTDAMYILGPMIGPKVLERPAAQEVSIKGTRKEVKDGETGPGPATYFLLDPERKPAWTMVPRRDSPTDQLALVGPKYLLPSAPKGPAWKLGQRYNDFTGILRTQCDIVDYNSLDRLY